MGFWVEGCIAWNDYSEYACFAPGIPALSQSDLVSAVCETGDKAIYRCTICILDDIRLWVGVPLAPSALAVPLPPTNPESIIAVKLTGLCRTPSVSC